MGDLVPAPLGLRLMPAPRQRAALRFVDERGTTTATEVAARFQVQPGTASLWLRRLRRDGLVSSRLLTGGSLGHAITDRGRAELGRWRDGRDVAA